jgi:hypothetical protein
MRTSTAVALFFVSARALVAQNNCRVGPRLGGGSDVGVRLAVAVTCTDYQDQRQWWRFRNTLAVGYTTAAGGGTIDYLGQYRPSKDGPTLSLEAAGVSTQFTWYFGEDNTATISQSSGTPQELYRARQSFAELHPTISLPLPEHVTVTVGPDLRYWNTTQAGAFVDSVRPYGVGPFGTFSGTFDARYDTRDSPRYPTRGFNVDLNGRGVPAMWGAVDAYGTMHIAASTYLTTDVGDVRPTLALRAGGDKLWNTAPFEDMPTIGSTPGTLTVRGYLPNRYPGTATTFGNIQLEIPVYHPSHGGFFGVMAIDDIGCAYVPDQASSCHNGAGAGIFHVGRLIIVSLSAVRGTDGTRFYVATGMGI